MDSLMDYRAASPQWNGGDNARFYSPYITHQFQQPDSIVPRPGDPQSLNRLSYVTNPINRIDPSGHVDQTKCNYRKNPKCDLPRDSNGVDSGEKDNYYNHIPAFVSAASNTTITTYRDYIPAFVSASSSTSTKNNIDEALYLLSKSPYGRIILRFLDENNIGVDYGPSGGLCQASAGNPIRVHPAHCNQSPVDTAGSIAHEAIHHIFIGDNSKYEEYVAFLVGDTVRNDLIQAGYGSSSDKTRYPMSVYTVDLNNPDKKQLTKDLDAWFKQNEKKYNSMIYTLPPTPQTQGEQQHWAPGY